MSPFSSVRWLSPEYIAMLGLRVPAPASNLNAEGFMGELPPGLTVTLWNCSVTVVPNWK